MKELGDHGLASHEIPKGLNQTLDLEGWVGGGEKWDCDYGIHDGSWGQRCDTAPSLVADVRLRWPPQV